MTDYAEPKPLGIAKTFVFKGGINSMVYHSKADIFSITFIFLLVWIMGAISLFPFIATLLTVIIFFSLLLFQPFLYGGTFLLSMFFVKIILIGKRGGHYKRENYIAKYNKGFSQRQTRL